MKIALAQINTTVGDLDGNTKKIINQIEQAKKQDANLVVFPELAITGYPPKDLLFKKAFVLENQKRLLEIQNATSDIGVIVGFVNSYFRERASDKIYDMAAVSHFSDMILTNAACLIDNQKILGIYEKIWLPTYDVFDEKRYFEPGKEAKVFGFCNKKIGINICEDLWVSNGPIIQQVKNGADLIIVISASPFFVGKWRIRKELVKKQAVANRVPIIYTNLVCGQDDLIFDGGSFAIDAQGNLIALAKHFAEDLLTIDIDSPMPVKDTEETEEFEVFNALVLGLRDYVNKNGFSKVVLGLSGGIDSALVCALAVEALGKERILAVIMPSPYTSEASIQDAKTLAQNLEIELLNIPITEIYNSYLKTLADPFKGKKLDVTEENIQARIRGNILMALSNKFGYLVLSTGNKSEMAVGYTTLYGDMAGGLAVISDVPKTMVYRLAHYFNQKAGKELIPKNIFIKPPSAELKPNQKDSDDLPPYETLDEILNLYIEENKDREEICKLGYPKDLVVDVIRRVDRNEYKRKQAPLGLKITPKAFGFGRRMPITNKFQ
ncbi:MAG: NAD+ synthase [candidate division WOR-3 bacterium]